MDNTTIFNVPLKQRKQRNHDLPQGLLQDALRAAEQAKAHMFAMQLDDGHWVAELESNCTITAEYVYLTQILGLELGERREKIKKYLFANQKTDGSWGIAFNYAGDISTTAETYLALRVLGVEITDARMRKAEKFIRDGGGLEKIRIFTRINFALFGLFPWDSVPVIPPEFILLPPHSPVNIYSLSSWARGTMVPLFVIFHHKPVFVLPNGKSGSNDWLDHLWLDPSKKNIPYCKPALEIIREDKLGWRSFFTGADVFLKTYEKVQTKKIPQKIREFAVKRCERWVLEHQEKSGDWAGIFPPMLNGVLALHLQGYPLTSDPVRLGLEAIERFGHEDHEGYRMQACESPIWDTVLGMIGILDCGHDPKDDRLLRARHWLAKKQLLVNYGDWKVYNPKGQGGGWAFEYENSWYPDVDDTAAAVIALLKQDPKSFDTVTVRRAVEWIVSMQNNDGGWAAFDINNDKTFLNKIPFSDMDSLCDPSSPDVAGRVLEALGLMCAASPEAAAKYADVCTRGIRYLRDSQEEQGSWYGRWGVNYVYGTSNVLCALMRQNVPASDAMIKKGVAWLRDVQNKDGGWGECLESYGDKSLMGKGKSTASQTAWGLMGLLAYLPPSDAAIQRGIQWLVTNQVSGPEGTGYWNEAEFTGTGFPNHFYLRYHMYRHYFPMMALGRFCQGLV